jgi:hypothetical protein
VIIGAPHAISADRVARINDPLTHTTVEIVEAPNPYQAAIVASGRAGDDVEIADVRPAVGRPTVGTKAAKKVARKRRPMSAETRAKLAQNLVKARAARARKQKAAKKTTRRVAKKR